MDTKPELRIARAGKSDSLPALTLLSALRQQSSYNELKDCRHPLGVYNLSIQRICDRVARCADRLHLFWTSASADEQLAEEIIDYFELAMYSAAEHVDDIERIASTFYRTDGEASRSMQVKSLKRSIKPLRDEVSNFTNTIKHAHGRVRLVEIGFQHDKVPIKLLGFFVEGFKEGGVGPHPILHGGGKGIFSVTSFLWNILTYIAQVSIEISRFLREIDACESGELKVVDAPQFRQAAIKMTRLPLYSFDDEHPFIRVKWQIDMDAAMLEAAHSTIYGSLCTPWSKSNDGIFIDYKVLYSGDGITKKFHLAQPKNLHIQHWT